MKTYKLLAVAVLAIASVLPMQVAAFDCAAFTDLARNTLQAHHRGVDRQAAEAIIQRMDGAQNRVLGMAIVSDAFRQSVPRTRAERDAAVERFGNNFALVCLTLTR